MTALTHYRQAFRLDPEVDKTYRLHLERLSTLPTLPAAPAEENHTEFTFERTLQLGPDYVNVPDEHRSSGAYLQSLLSSFQEHPFKRDRKDEEEGVTLEPTRFHADDEERGTPFSSLPAEIVQLILRHVALTSVIPPPSAPIEPSKPLGRRQKRFTAREERYRMEDEVEVPNAVMMAGTSRTDVEALERFARVCRAARVACMDEGLWRCVFVDP